MFKVDPNYMGSQFGENQWNTRGGVEDDHSKGAGLQHLESFKGGGNFAHFLGGGQSIF